MKKQIFTAMFLLAIISVTSRVAAQPDAVAEKKKGNWDVKTNNTAKVTTTPTGCTITFSSEIKSPRDLASGQATGKRMHKPYCFAVNSADNSVTEISSPKDGSTGQPGGKVSVSDLSVMISLEKASVGRAQPKKLPVDDGQFSLPEDFQNGDCDVTLSWSWGASNRCTKTFTVTMQEGQLMAINTKGTGAQNH